MGGEVVFRLIFLGAMVALFAIRVVSQSRVRPDRGDVAIHEGAASLVAGSIAALTTLVFGAEYLIVPGSFGFAYALAYPLWLRWAGALVLVVGVALLGWAHRHLGRNFHSLVVSRPNQILIQSGPYRHIRHPIYSAYLLSYLGGGLLASNWVLTFVPTVCFTVLVCIRVPQEERILMATFGDRYRRYKARTGSLLPRLWG